MNTITIIMSIALIAICLCGICIKILVQKNGQFSGTCASNNPFLNKEGEAVYQTEFTPISWHGTPEGSLKSLQPGETWSTDQNNFFDINVNALEDWDPGSVRIKIGSVEIDD